MLLGVRRHVAAFKARTCPRTPNANGAEFVAGLSGMGVEAGMGEAVDFGVVHGQEDFAFTHGGGDVECSFHLAAAAADDDFLLVVKTECFGIIGVHFEHRLSGGKFA